MPSYTLRTRDGSTHSIHFPEALYSVTAAANPEFKTTRYRFRYESFVTPDSVFEYDMRTRRLTLLKRAEVLGGFDAARYRVKRIFAAAADGTRIPVSLVYKKGLRRDGRHALLLEGYGAYGISFPVAFSADRLSLLERNVSYAVAHVRGGGEICSTLTFVSACSYYVNTACA